MLRQALKRFRQVTRSWRGPVLSCLVPWGRVLPPRVAWRLGALIGFLFAFLSSREPRRAREHLRRAFPERSAAWVATTAEKAFVHFCACLIWSWASFSRGSLTGGFPVVVENPARFRTAWRSQRAGRGAVVLSGHFGNWEMLARVCGRHFPTTVLGRRLRDPDLDRLVERFRTTGRNRFLAQDAGLLACLRELREARFLGTLPDQDIPRLAGTFVPWFGHPAWTPTGPATLAVMGRVPLLPAFCYRHRGHWVIHYGPMVEPGAFGADREQAARAATAWATAYLETLVRRHPHQWVWWHRRWRTQPGTAQSVAQDKANP